MPNTKNKKSKQPALPPPKKHTKLFWFLAVILVLTGAALLTPIVLQYQKDQAIAADRLRFEKADQDVKAVADAIVAALGQPYKTSESKSCSRPSAKWEVAPLSCKTGYDISFIISDPNQANNYYQSISKITKKILNYKSSSTSNNINNSRFSLLEEGFDQKIFEVYSSKNSQMECRVTYKYFSKDIDTILESSINCGDTAKFQVYYMQT